MLNLNIMSSKKKIAINPDFFKNANISDDIGVVKKESKKERRKRKKKEKSNKKLLKPNEIKRQLIKRIKQHQKEKEEDLKNKKKSDKNSSNDNFENDYQESLSYLEQIKKEKKKNKQRRTMKKRNYSNIGRNRPSVNFNDTLQLRPNLTDKSTGGFSNNSNNEPAYGILKGGNKQLYSSYRKTLKNRDKHRNIYRPNVKIYTTGFGEEEEDIERIEPNSTNSTNSAKPTNLVANVNDNINQAKGVNELMNFISDEINNITTNQNIVNKDNTKALYEERRNKLKALKKKHKPRIKTIKRYKKKFKLGKNKKNGTISILIKNKKTRKRIKDEHKMRNKTQCKSQ